MKRTLKWFLIVAGVIAAGAVIFFIAAPLVRGPAAAGATTLFEYAEVTRGSLDTTILASGSVRASQTAVLNWQATGKVGQVNVEAGQVVKAGDVLAELDLTSLSQSLIQAQSDLINAKQDLQDLYDNAGATTAQAQSKLVAAEKELEDAKKERESYKYARAADDTIEVARANLALAQKELDEAQDRYDQVKDRGEDDPMRAQALSMLADARQKRDRNQYNLNYLIGGPDALDVAEADARVTVAETALVNAQREYDRVKDGPSAQDIELAQNRVTIAQAAVNQALISAPFNGTVTDLFALTGDMVTPSTIAMRLDDLSALYVDLQVSEVDVNKLSIGQQAEVTLDAIPTAVYKAEVSQVGRVGSSSSGVVYFTVTLKLTETDDQVRPGMTASASIAVNRVDNVLMVPNRAVVERDGQRVVYIPNDQTLFSAVPVEIGSANESMTVIVSGLEEGQRIITNPPSDNAEAGGMFMMGPGGGRPGNGGQQGGGQQP